MKSVGDEKQENISKSTNVLDLQRKLMDLSEMDRSKFFIMFYTRQFVKRVSYYTNKLLSKYRCILVLARFAIELLGAFAQSCICFTNMSSLSLYMPIKQSVAFFILQNNAFFSSRRSK